MSMMKCDPIARSQCQYGAYCEAFAVYADKSECAKFNQVVLSKPKTNADRIRAMSDEELAWELMTWRIETEAKHQGIESNYPNTQATILEWLKRPAEEG